MENAGSRLSRTSNTLIIIVLGFLILRYAAWLIVPVAWSVFLALSIMPLCKWLEDRRFPRMLAVSISIVVLTLFIGVVIYVLLNQVAGLLRDTPDIARKIDIRIKQASDYIVAVTGFSFSTSDFSAFVRRDQVGTILRAGAESLAMAGIVPVFVFFFVYYRDFFSEFLKRKQTSLAWSPKAIHVVQEYLLGMLLVTIIVFVMASLVFYLMGIRYYILFGLFIAIFNLIPYLGVVLSSIVSVIYVLLVTDSLLYPVMTLALLWLIQAIENNLITPVIVGSRIRLNPLAVILVIIVGGSLWGVSGMVLGIPMVGILKIIFQQTPSMEPYAYLLGDEIPVTRQKEDFFRLIGKRWHSRANTKSEGSTGNG